MTKGYITYPSTATTYANIELISEPGAALCKQCVSQQKIGSPESTGRQIKLCYPEFPIEFHATDRGLGLGTSPNQNPGLSGTGRRKRRGVAGWRRRRITQ